MAPARTYTVTIIKKKQQVRYAQMRQFHIKKKKKTIVLVEMYKNSFKIQNSNLERIF